MAAGLAAVLLGAAAGCRPGAPTGRIDPDSIMVEIGSGGLRNPLRWNRAVVGARAAEGVFHGEVEISGTSFFGQRAEETFSRRFLAAGVQQIVEVPFRGKDWDELIVTFRGDDGRSTAVKVKLGLESRINYRILVIGDGALDTSALSDAIESWLRPGEESPEPGSLKVDRGRMSPLEMPRHFLGYDTADLVILHRTSLGNADPATVEALLEWVRRGGTLVGLPGPEWSGKLPAELLGLFGVVSAPRPLEEGPIPAVPRETADADRYLKNGSFYSATPAPGARPLEDGLLIENRFGGGRAFLFTYVPTAALLDKSRGSYLPAELARAWERVTATGGATVRTVSSRAMSRLEGQAVQILVWFSGFRYPPRSGVLLFILGYLVVGFFIAGFYFHRRRRLERMYLVALAIAAAASIGIYRFGLLSGISELGVDEVAVAAVRPGSAVADVAGFLGISSPSHLTLEPDLENTPLSGAVPSQPAGSQDEGRMVVRFGPMMESPGSYKLLPMDYNVEGSAIRLPRIRILPNATRYLRFDYPLDLGGPLEAAFREDGLGPRTLEVTNGTRYSLEIHLVDGSGGFSEYGVQGSGEKKEYPIRPGMPLGSLDPELGFNRMSLQRDDLDRRQVSREFRTALFRSLAARARDERRGSSPAYLVAEVQEPLFPTSALGPVRRSLGFLVAEVDEAGEGR